MDQDTGLSYSRCLTVQTRAVGDGNADLLNLARKRALDPSVFDEHPPFFFPGEISSSRWDAYETKMGSSSLRNYADEAGAGVAFMRNHNTREDPTGHTLTGKFIQGSGNGVARAEAEFYVLNDPETAPYVRKLRAGTVRDLSIGFYGGEWICSICGGDMEQWMSRDGCPHFLGMTYTPADEAGVQQGEPQVARATIENAHLAEVSGVYEGATPGAMITKARGMAAGGLLDDTARDLIQVRYRIALPGHGRSFPVTVALKETPMPEGSTQAADKVETDGIRLSDGRLVTAVDVRTLEQRLADLHGTLESAEVPAQGHVEGVRWLIAERTRLLPLEAETARLRPLAADGEAYRADLVEDALREGVRAQGNEFARETYEGVLRSAPLATVKRMRDDWKAIGDRALPGGRLTSDGPGQPAEKLTDRAPAGAYAA